MKNPLHNVAIVGAYNTEQARRIPGASSDGLALQALRGALDDATLNVQDIDGIAAFFMEPELNSMLMAGQLGHRPSWVAGNNRLGVALLTDAALAINAGLCSTVAIFGGGASMLAPAADSGHVSHWTRPVEEWTECWGLFTPAEFALVAQRQIVERGVTPRQAAMVASIIRNNGSITEKATNFGKPSVTPEDVLASRNVASPLHLLDCCMNSEGGGAMIVTSIERARDLDVTPVYLHGAGLEVIDKGYHLPGDWSLSGDLGQRAANIAFQQAGIARSDIDFGEIYDPTSYEVIRQLEAFGICKPGEGGGFVEEGNVELGGAFPICTDGGTMAFSHSGTTQTIQKLIAAVQQLRGRAGQTQVKDAEFGIVSNAGSAACLNDVAILGASPASP